MELRLSSKIFWVRGSSRGAQRSEAESGAKRVFKMQGASKVGLSLAPGFSPVWNRRERTSRFNGFSAIPEAAEAAEPPARHESPG